MHRRITFLALGLVTVLLTQGCSSPQTQAVSAAQSEAPRWEYRVVPICQGEEPYEVLTRQAEAGEKYAFPNTCLAAETVEATLNEMGAQGWELVTIHEPLPNFEGGLWTGFPQDLGRLVFKRQMP